MLLNSRNKQDTAFNGQLNPPNYVHTNISQSHSEQEEDSVLPQMEAVALDSLLFPTQLLCLNFLPSFYGTLALVLDH